MASNKTDGGRQNSREAKRNQPDKAGVVQRGIAFPSPSVQEHLLIIRLDITGALFTQGVDEARTTVKNGLKRLCLLFDRIHEGKKMIDELDKNGMIVSRKLEDEPPHGFSFSATIGFGASFFEQLDIPINKRPKNLREMPDHDELGDVTPYSLGQTDMIIQLGSTKDFVNLWVLENSVQPDEDEPVEKLLKKQIEGHLNDETQKKKLEELLDDTTPERVGELKAGERFCADGQKLSSVEEECVPDIVTAIQEWATDHRCPCGFPTH